MTGELHVIDLGLAIVIADDTHTSLGLTARQAAAILNTDGEERERLMDSIWEQDGSAVDDNFRLTEEQTRAKAIELLDMCNQTRLEAWMMSGLNAGVLDADTVEKVLNEELHRRSPEVQHFWKGPCTDCVHVSPN